MMWLRKAFNQILDTIVRPEVHVFHITRSTFVICGYAGLALATLLCMLLVMYQGLSLWISGLIVVTAGFTFLGLNMLTKIITGEERVVCYHHQVAVLLVTTGLLLLLDQPVLPYLDATMLGVGLFIACGRVGCLMVGCCHGRPHRWGVCYRQEHLEAGFESYLVDVRLFPIQAVASLWLFVNVLVGSALVLRGDAPGAALAWYIIAYGVGRFCVEFLRGDAARPYLWGFSEAQWTSLLVTAAVVGAEMAGTLPLQPWHAAVPAGLVLTMGVVTFARRASATAKYRLLHPRHVQEVAEVVNQVAAVVPEAGGSPITMDVRSTSLGICLSASKIRGKDGSIDHYALSAKNGAMSRDKARILANLIVRLKHPAHPIELISGNQGVFHLLIHPLAAGNQK